MEFEAFAAARLPALLRYAVLLSGDPEQARDIVQDVLARALVKWGRIGKVDEPYAYVRRMVTNEYLSWRRRRRLPTVPLDAEALGRPAAVTGDDEMWPLLATLPKQQRAVLVLRFYEGLSDAEIADVLGCRAGTVRSNASRGLVTLRVELTGTATGPARTTTNTTANATSEGTLS
jgi:RNA polymerase sigma-70 factor (sigma-E family)